MTKQKKPIKPLFKFGNPISGFGGGLRDILVAAATHPTTAGIAVMVLTSSVKMLSGAYQENTQQRKKLSGELTGLYNGAQSLAAAACVVPVAVGALNLATEAVGKMGARGAPPVPVPPP